MLPPHLPSLDQLDIHAVRFSRKERVLQTNLVGHRGCGGAPPSLPAQHLCDIVQGDAGPRWIHMIDDLKMETAFGGSLGAMRGDTLDLQANVLILQQNRNGMANEALMWLSKRTAPPEEKDW